MGLVCDILHAFDILSLLIHLVNTIFNPLYSFGWPAFNNSSGIIHEIGVLCDFICCYAVFISSNCISQYVLVLTTNHCSFNYIRSSVRSFPKHCFYVVSYIDERVIFLIWCSKSRCRIPGFFALLFSDILFYLLTFIFSSVIILFVTSLFTILFNVRYASFFPWIVFHVIILPVMF